MEEIQEGRMDGRTRVCCNATFSSESLYPKDDRNQGGYHGIIIVCIYPVLIHISRLRSVALEVS